MAKTSTQYTYVDMANEMLAVLHDGLELDGVGVARATAKLNAFIESQEKKAEYNKANPKKSTAKGASPETQANANAIAAILGKEPKTAKDIGIELGREFSALQVSNAVKFIPNVEKAQVVRTVIDNDGLTQQKKYAAYFIA